MEKVMTALTDATSPADQLRLVDVYKHLKKTLDAALASGDETDAALFEREFIACYRAQANADEWRDASGEDPPSPEQVSDFKSTVLTWMKLEAEERELKKRIADNRRVRALLDQAIVQFMSKYDLDDAETELGTLRLVRSTSKRALSKTAMLERLEEFFADDTASAEALKLNMFAVAATVSTTRLKRVTQPAPRLTGAPLRITGS